MQDRDGSETMELRLADAVEALAESPNGKGAGWDQIPVEAWKLLGNSQKQKVFQKMREIARGKKEVAHPTRLTR